MAEAEISSKPEDGSDEFKQFLHNFGDFITKWGDQVITHCEGADSRLVMRLQKDAMVNSWHGAQGELSNIYDRLSADGRTQLNQAIRKSGMDVFVEGAISLVTSGQLVSSDSLLSLGSIFEKVKSFIECVLSCLGIEVPCLIRCLFDLLDNFLGLFAQFVSPEHALYFHELENRVSRVRQNRQRERNLRKGGCSCSDGNEVS